MKQIILYSLDEAKKHLEELKQIKIWVCNTACGKSYLCSIDDRFFDLDAYRSELHHLGVENFDEMTIPKMFSALKEGKIILNAAHGHFLSYLEENNIPFVYMYGKPEVENEYIERMRHRGSSEDFIQRFGTIIASHYSNRAKDKRGTYKIELNSKEFVSDYAWAVFGKPEKYIKFKTFEFNPYKIAFVDLDGTLLNRNGELTEFTIDAIRKLKNKIKIVITTSRGLGNVKPILEKLSLNTQNDYVICANGSLIINGNEEIQHKAAISKQNIYYLLNQVDKKFLENCYISTIDKKVFFNEIKNLDLFIENNEIYKIVFEYSNIKDMDISSDLSSHFNIYKSCSELIEFVNKNCSKGKAVNSILKTFNLSRHDAIVFGDTENELEIMKLAGCGIAVCNAEPRIKEQATYITDSNNDDGVVKALLKIVI